MSILLMQGFDVYDVTTQTLPNIIKLWGYGADRGWDMYGWQPNNLTWKILEAEGRRWFGSHFLAGNIGASEANMMMQMATASINQPRTGKWRWGVRVRTGPNTTSSTNTLVYMTNTSGGIKASGVSIAPNTQVYLTFEVDWVAGTAKLFLNSNFTTPVFNVAVGAAENFIFYVGHWGSQSPIMVPSAVANSWLGYTDIYFAVETANDPNPIGLLGPVKITGIKAASVSAPGWSTTDTTYPTPLDVLNTGYGSDMSKMFSPMAKGDTKANNSATLRLQTPTPTGDIVGISLVARATRTNDGDASLKLQLTDGTNNGPITTTALQDTKTALPVINHGVLHKALDGTTWTAEKLAALALQITVQKPS